MTTFFERMNRIVGDQNTVARYLVEKIGHVALIAWVLVMFGHLEPLMAALLAACIYTIVGKIVWYYAHTTFDPVDMVFDFILVLLVAIIALGWSWWVPGAFLLWLLCILTGSNNQWGSPS